MTIKDIFPTHQTRVVLQPTTWKPSIPFKSPKLKYIDLSCNQLEGPLPLWWVTKVSSFLLRSIHFPGQFTPILTR
ncbi:hypothetical protein FF1_036249 [Malus domestica]